MKETFAAAWVIARRDFVATTHSRAFILFLLAPLFVALFSVSIAMINGQSDREARQAVVAVIGGRDLVDPLQQAHDRLADGVAPGALPLLKAVDPEKDVTAQARRLLVDPQGDFSVTVTGPLDHPTIMGPQGSLDGIGKGAILIVNQARATAALDAAHAAIPTGNIRTVVTPRSTASLAYVRHGLARGGQGLIFFLTVMLATQLLSNMVEEKSNKVIEILAAAVPLDAVFLGKLIAMLGTSLIGILFWGTLGLAAIFYFDGTADVPVTPSVGWPAYCLLVVAYFVANFVLLGSLFLGIGSQASTVREVQTLSMPVTFGQLLIFALASVVVGKTSGALLWFAAIFPFSSPLAMIGIAAQSPLLWPHLLAILWQALWAWIFIRIGARMFRMTVMKSGAAASSSFIPRRTRPAGSGRPDPAIPRPQE